MSGQKKVTATARAMATPAHTMPLRAVAGELIFLRPRMNITAVRK